MGGENLYFPPDDGNLRIQEKFYKYRTSNVGEKYKLSYYWICQDRQDFFKGKV
jgi:hypothetical protein